ncbi:MAG: hypothetical protein ACQEV0_00655 [Bacillota bacterium]
MEALYTALAGVDFKDNAFKETELMAGSDGKLQPKSYLLVGAKYLQIKSSSLNIIRD